MYSLTIRHHLMAYLPETKLIEEHRKMGSPLNVSTILIWSNKASPGKNSTQFILLAWFVAPYENGTHIKW